MVRNGMKVCLLWVATVAPGAWAQAATQAPATPAKLSAAEIADRNVAARGGLQAWRAVQTLRLIGKLEAGGNTRTTLPMPMPGGKDSHFMPPPRPAEQARLPFVLELKRPKKMRVEVVFQGQTALQVFDGRSGWKLRPFLNRREVEPFTEEEAKAMVSQAELDGPLVDYAGKGTVLELAGVDKVDGRDTYKLKLTEKSGHVTHLWIDCGTFLEAKVEGAPRRMDGRERPVEVYYRDFRAVSGLKIPFLLETRVLNDAAIAGPMRTASEQMFLEKVEINSTLNDALFSKTDLDAAASGRASATTAAAKIAP